MRMRVLQSTLLATLLITLPVSVAATSPAVAKGFVPEEVFMGRSEGKGEMRLLLGKTRAFTVESLGARQSDGRMRLEQKVRFEGKPVQARSWVLWETAPGRYSATLTDAAGPVAGRTDGRRMTLRYPLTRWGLVMHQTLELSEDEQSLANYGTIRFMGVEVGQLRETIRLMH